METNSKCSLILNGTLLLLQTFSPDGGFLSIFTQVREQNTENSFYIKLDPPAGSVS